MCGTRLRLAGGPAASCAARLAAITQERQPRRRHACDEHRHTSGQDDGQPCCQQEGRCWAGCGGCPAQASTWSAPRPPESADLRYNSQHAVSWGWQPGAGAAAPSPSCWHPTPARSTQRATKARPSSTRRVRRRPHLRTQPRRFGCAWATPRPRPPPGTARQRRRACRAPLQPRRQGFFAASPFSGMASAAPSGTMNAARLCAAWRDTTWQHASPRRRGRGHAREREAIRMARLKQRGVAMRCRAEGDETGASGKAGCPARPAAARRR